MPRMVGTLSFGSGRFILELEPHVMMRAKRIFSQVSKRQPGRTLAQPLPTITGGDQMAIVRGDEMRPLSIGEYLAGQGLPRDYFEGVCLTRKEASRAVGNAVAVPCAERLLREIAQVAA